LGTQVNQNLDIKNLQKKGKKNPGKNCLFHASNSSTHKIKNQKSKKLKN
jgi:hypothetical protein